MSESPDWDRGANPISGKLTLGQEGHFRSSISSIVNNISMSSGSYEFIIANDDHSVFGNVPQNRFIIKWTKHTAFVLPQTVQTVEVKTMDTTVMEQENV